MADPMTPTDDLRARHLSESELKWLLTSPKALEALADYHDWQQSMGESQGIDCTANEAARHWYAAEAKRIEEAWQREEKPEQRVFAALSAPAKVGGEDEPFGYYIETIPPKAFDSTFTRAPELAEMKSAEAHGRVKVTKLYTTPPPNAALKCECWYGSHNGKHKEGCPDAAVGAQGEVDEVNLRSRAIEAIKAVTKEYADTGAEISRYVDFLAAERMRLWEQQRHTTAAPAAGKGVDDAARALVEKLHAIHAHPAYQAVWFHVHNHGAPYTGPKYEAELAALEAALTRQPVAGDGRHIGDDDTIAWRCPRCIRRNRPCPHTGENWRAAMAAEDAAAPTDTPADGGEGKA